jgi:hypothetical protein
LDRAAASRSTRSPLPFSVGMQLQFRESHPGRNETFISGV